MAYDFRAMGRRSSAIFAFLLIFPIFPTSLQPRGYAAECLKVKGKDKWIYIDSHSRISGIWITQFYLQISSPYLPLPLVTIQQIAPPLTDVADI